MRQLFPVFMVILLCAGVFANYFAVSHDDTLVAGEENDYLVHVRDKTTREPIAHAAISLVFESRELALLETNDQGYAMFHLLPESDGVVEFRVTHPEYYDYVIVQDILPATEEKEPVVAEEEPAAGEVPADTTPATGFLTEDGSDNVLWVFLLGVIAVALVVFGYYFYTRDEDEDLLEPEEMSLEERYDIVKNELEGF